MSPYLKRWGGVVMLIMAAIQQAAALHLHLQHHEYAEALLSGMVLVCLALLGGSTAWQRVSVPVMRPFIIWFCMGSFLLFSFNTMTGVDLPEGSFYLAYYFLVAASFVLLRLQSAILLTVGAGLLLVLGALSHTPYDLHQLLSTLFIGGLIGFLTVHGASIREDYVDEPLSTSAFSQPQLVRARLQDLLTWQKQPLERSAFLLLEVETLYNIRDVHGPELASQVMERLERALRQSVPGGDYVWRYGDRFLLLMNNTDLRMAGELGRHLTEQAGTLEVVRGEELRVSGALAFLNERPTLDQVIELAQVRLYAARRGGSGPFMNGQARSQVSAEDAH